MLTERRTAGVSDFDFSVAPAAIDLDQSGPTYASQLRIQISALSP